MFAHFATRLVTVHFLRCDSTVGRRHITPSPIINRLIHQCVRIVGPAIKPRTMEAAPASTRRPPILNSNPLIIRQGLSSLFKSWISFLSFPVISKSPTPSLILERKKNATNEIMPPPVIIMMPVTFKLSSERTALSVRNAPQIKSATPDNNMPIKPNRIVIYFANHYFTLQDVSSIHGSFFSFVLSRYFLPVPIIKSLSCSAVNDIFSSAPSFNEFNFNNWPILLSNPLATHEGHESVYLLCNSSSPRLTKPRA